MSQIYIKFKTLTDLVRFIILSPTPFLHYVNLNSHNMYFVQIAGLGERVLYYVELEKKIDEKYIVFNRFKDSISFSNKLESDGQSISIPTLEVEKTNAFQDLSI